jgi:hypothetical protein
MSDFRDSSTGFFFFAAFGAAIRCSSEFREIPAKFSENWRTRLRKSAAFRKIPPQFAVAVQKFTNIGKFGESIAIVKKMQNTRFVPKIGFDTAENESQKEPNTSILYRVCRAEP